MELFNLALQTDSNDNNLKDLKQYLDRNIEEDKETKSTQEGLTEEELKLLENDFSKQLTPKQVQHAMSILRGLREGATPREREIAFVSSDA